MVYVKDIKYYYFRSHTLSTLLFTESVYESSKAKRIANEYSKYIITLRC